jgi:tRNA pseudouridine55 synthase
LRRLAVGPYTLARAHALRDLEDQEQPAPVIPLADAAAAAFPRLDLTGDEASRLAQGARLPLPQHVPQSPADGPQAPIAAFAPDGSFVALVAAEGDRLRSLAVFA